MNEFLTLKHGMMIKYYKGNYYKLLTRDITVFISTQQGILGWGVGYCLGGIHCGIQVSVVLSTY
jgi:hypothetical protein